MKTISEIPLVCKIFFGWKIFFIIFIFLFFPIQTTLAAPESVLDRRNDPPPQSMATQSQLNSGNYIPSNSNNSNLGPMYGTSGYNPNSFYQPLTDMRVIDNIGGNNQLVKTMGGNTSAPLAELFNQAVYAMLAVAIGLAIFMIIRGGYEYMTSGDNASGKGAARNRIKASVGGLVLALGSVTLLNFINPEILNVNLNFPALTRPDAAEIDIRNSVNQYLGMTDAQYQNFLQTGQIPTNISPTAQRILAEALNSVNTLHTTNTPLTEGGRRACAAAVNTIVERATGQQVGGDLLTADMYTALQHSQRFAEVPGGYANSLPGDIIISPTNREGTGHVGIVSAPGATAIISNSSNEGVVRQNPESLTGQGWVNHYAVNGTYIFRPL